MMTKSGLCLIPILCLAPACKTSGGGPADNRTGEDSTTVVDSDGETGVLHTGSCEDGLGSGTSVIYTNTWGPMIEGKTSAQVGFEFRCDGGPCLCGVFADEHTWWVAPPPGSSGIVEVVGFSPDDCADCVEASGQGASLRDGWLASPSGDIGISRMMDGRLGEGADQPEPAVPSEADPYRVDTTTAGFVARSIVKADSNLDTGDDCRGVGPETTRMCVEYFEAIAVLAEAPPGNGASVLRPTLFGGSDSDKALVDVSQIDLALLPSMDIEVRAGTGEAPGIGWQGALEALRSPKLEWFFDFPGTEVGAAGRNRSTSTVAVSSGYGPGKHKLTNEALLYLTFDPAQQGGTADLKDLLTIRAVQAGLDICAIILHGGSDDDAPGEFGSWPANGGHNGGRYARAVVAATLVDHGDCKAALRLASDHHLKSFCIGGDDDGQRCGDHWGLATCAGGVCTVSTDPADQCDEHRTLFAETSQMQAANTHGAAGAGIALYGGWTSLVRPLQTAGSNPIHSDDEAWIDGGSGDGAGCPGPYQSIAWSAFQVQLPVLKGIPAAWELVDPAYLEFMQRTHVIGEHCTPDNRVDRHGQPDQSGNEDQVVQRCSGGEDSGRPCRQDSECTNGSCDASGPLYGRPGVNYRSPDYTSLQGLYQYEANWACYDDCSCSGLQGLCP